MNSDYSCVGLCSAAPPRQRAAAANVRRAGRFECALRMQANLVSSKPILVVVAYIDICRCFMRMRMIFCRVKICKVEAIKDSAVKTNEMSAQSDGITYDGLSHKLEQLLVVPIKLFR